MLNKDQYQKIGKLTKPHGVLGEVLVRLTPEFCRKTIEPEWLFLDIDGGLVPFEVSSLREKMNDAIIVKFEGVDSENSAKIYQGLDIYINPEDVLKVDNDEQESTEYEFIGYTVLDKKHGNIGYVHKLIDIPQNPLLSVINGEIEILIPRHDDFIVSINQDRRELQIEAPTGLIEMYF